MVRRIAVLALSATLLFACNLSHDPDECPGGGCEECADVVCEECTDAVSLRVNLIDGGGPVTVGGIDVTCEEVGDIWYCGARSLEDGDYRVSISAPGYQTETIYFTHGGPGSGTACCPCPPTFSRYLTLHREGADGGA